MPIVRKRFRTNENNNDANDFDDNFDDDDDDAQYDWSRKIDAKLVLKDDDENAGGNDFSFEKGIPMEQTSSWRVRDDEGDETRHRVLGSPCMKCRQLREATAARLKRTTRRSWDGYYITKSKGKKANISANAPR